VLVVAIAATLVSVVTVPGATLLGLLVGLTGLAVLVASQGLLWHRQRQLTGDLQRSQSSFKTLVKSSVDPVVILDDQLRVTFASESVADLVGVDPAGMTGRPITATVHRDDAPVLVAALSSPPAEGSDFAVRTARVRHADGRWRLIAPTPTSVPWSSTAGT
jgi:PAS domain S-box-containing protein